MKNLRWFYQNGIDIDIEDNLSHLVLDARDGIVPRPGVWSSPSNLPLSPPKVQQPAGSVKHVCTVEELEQGLIVNRPPPGLSKPPIHQQYQQVMDSFRKIDLHKILSPEFMESIKYRRPPGIVPPSTMRLPHPQFMQNRMPSKFRKITKKNF